MRAGIIQPRHDWSTIYYDLSYLIYQDEYLADSEHNEIAQFLENMRESRRNFDQTNKRYK